MHFRWLLKNPLENGVGSPLGMLLFIVDDKTSLGQKKMCVLVGRYCMKTFTGPLHIPTYLANIYIYRQFYLVYIQYLLSYKQVIHQEKVISLEVWPNMILFLSVFFVSQYNCLLLPLYYEVDFLDYWHLGVDLGHLISLL